MNKDKIKEEFEKKFNEEFGYKDKWEFHDGYNPKEDGWNGASMVKSAGCDDCGKCQNSREAMRDFLFDHLSAQYEKLIEEVIGEDEISTCDDEKASVAWCNCKEVADRNALRHSIRTSLQERGVMIK